MGFRHIAAGLLVAYAAQCAMAVEQADTPAELAKMFEQDQADRKSPDIDWDVVGARDDEREMRVKALIATDALRSGADFYHAAMILQHAPSADDSLLAHDLCVIAIGKGEERAKKLAAASLDRFLVRIDRPQRFATQYGSNRANAPMSLARVDPAVPDSLRRELDVPPLAEAKKREEKFAKEFAERKKSAAIR